MTLKRLDDILIVVDDLEAVKAFFFELGLDREERTVTAPAPDAGAPAEVWLSVVDRAENQSTPG